MVTLRKHFKPSDFTILLFKDTRPVRHAFQLVLIISFRNESSCEFKILKKLFINERIHNLTRSVANENPEFVHLKSLSIFVQFDIFRMLFIVLIKLVSLMSDIFL